jgi:hypothetical protein
MEIVGLGILAISALASLGSFICWIMVLIKMFGNAELGGVGKGIAGVICGLYALIWGWQNREAVGIQTVMNVWLGCFLGSMGLSFIGNMIAAAG